jgi:hypothetical protein
MIVQLQNPKADAVACFSKARTRLIDPKREDRAIGDGDATSVDCTRFGVARK